MKKNLSIIISIIVIVILLSVWAYLLVTQERRAASQDETFSGLSFPGSTGSNTATDEGSGFSDNNTGQTNTPDETPLRLRQLTTRHTAGYREVVRASSTPPTVLVAESGTGHIYEINLATGQELRISMTTVPDTKEVQFTKTGDRIVYKTGVGAGTLIVGTLQDSNTVNTNTVATDVTSMRVYDNGVLYTSEGNSFVTVTWFDFAKETKQTRFTVPFRESAVRFGSSLSGPHIAFPKPSNQLEGFIYSYTNTQRQRLPIDGFGLAATLAGDTVVSIVRNQNSLSSSLYTSADTSIVKAALVVIPDKCTAVSNSSQIVCAHDAAAPTAHETYDNWLKGIHRFNDDLWFFSRTSGVEMKLIDIEAESGRIVDVSDLHIGETGDLYFRNKNDSTVWWYDLSSDQASIGSE